LAVTLGLTFYPDPAAMVSGIFASEKTSWQHMQRESRLKGKIRKAEPYEQDS
jgi:hypothetical protein